MTSELVIKAFFPYLLLMLSSLVAQKGKNRPANAGDLGLIPGSGRSPGEGNSYSLQYLVWRIPGTEESGGLLSIGCKRVGYN